ERFCPGPLTIVLKKNSCVPSVASAGLDSIAIRMPSHPVARALIRALKEPIVAPSANISGTPSATRCEHVMEDFKGKIAAVIDGGPTHYGIESTVISLIGNRWKLLRPGAIDVKKLEEVIREPLFAPSSLDLESPMAPGMKYRHYAPKTEILLFQKERLLQEILWKEPDRFRMVLSREKLPFAIPERSHCFSLNAPDFYSLLRQADSLHYEQILIFCDEKTLFDLALMNRILKAAS
ncbi:MAG: L-threonylcarbamoyladenylate synthase, partial [Chlamydiales bacterium]|nr:L-threonylcarbamoyladenylate synthase [Chlamydiales bacterium]